jgi:hypothetical protein
MHRNLEVCNSLHILSLLCANYCYFNAPRHLGASSPESQCQKEGWRKTEVRGKKG